VGVAIALASGANRWPQLMRSRRAWQQLSRSFPPSLQYLLGYDSSIFVRLSIVEVAKTLFEAVALRWC